MPAIPFPEMEKRIVEEKLLADRTPHGIPFPSEEWLKRREAEGGPRLDWKVAAAIFFVLFLAAVLVLIAALSSLSFFYIGLAAICIFPLVFAAFFVLGGILLFLRMSYRSLSGKFRRAITAVRAFYEPVLASLPEQPIEARIEGFDDPWGISLAIIGEPEETTSKLMLKLPSHPGVEFSFRFKEVYEHENTYYRAFCMYATADSKVVVDEFIPLFEAGEASQKDFTARSLQEKILREPALTSRPAWMFRLPDHIRILGLVFYDRDFNSIRFSDGKALVRMTINPDAGAEGIGEAVALMLKTVGLMKRTGAI